MKIEPPKTSPKKVEVTKKDARELKTPAKEDKLMAEKQEEDKIEAPKISQAKIKAYYTAILSSRLVAPGMLSFNPQSSPPSHHTHTLVICQ